MTAPDARLRADVMSALMPRTGEEASALVEALDLFVGYCGRFSVRDKRFSMLDDAAVDDDLARAAQEIRRRVIAAFGAYLGKIEVKRILRARRGDSDDVTPLPPAPSERKIDIYSNPICAWRHCPHSDVCRAHPLGCVNAPDPDPGPKGAA